MLALCACGASARGNASEESADSTLSSMDAAASVTAAIVRSFNDAVVDDYVLQSLTNGSGPVGAAQPCVTADNRLSQRPSALANPPYAEASIVQRDRVVRVLGAYAFLVATVSRDAANADAAFAAADFERASFALSAAANVHAQGDLFVEDRAAALVASARRPRDAREGSAIREVVVRANPAVQQLIALIRADVAKHRLEAIAATQLELRDLLAYGAPVPASPPSRASLAGKTPACSKPLVVLSVAAPTAPEPDVSAAIAALAPVLRSRAEKTRQLLLALTAINFERLFDALNEEARAATDFPLRRSKIEDAAKDIQRESAAIDEDGRALMSARL